MPLKLNTASGGSVTLDPANTASNFTLTVPAQTATVATLTTPSFATTIGVGGATAAASGAGITFPATQSASTDGNTLDDYEEGTFTPTVSGVTLASSSGIYTKVGRQVFVAFDITWPTTSNTTGITIASLPFTPATNSGALSCGYTSYANVLVGVCGPAGIQLYGYLGNPASTPQNVHMSGLRLIASATYTV